MATQVATKYISLGYSILMAGLSCMHIKTICVCMVAEWLGVNDFPSVA